MSIDFINYLRSIYQTNSKQNPIKMIRNRLYRDMKMAFEHGTVNNQNSMINYYQT